MPELLGWWIYVVSVPLGVGALLTMLSLGGRGKKGARAGKRVSKPGKPAALPRPQAVSGKGAKMAPVKAAPLKIGTAESTTGKVVSRKTAVEKAPAHRARAAELPPLFLLQNFLLIWSVVALAAVPFHPQKASAVVLVAILGAVATISAVLLAICARLFIHVTPVDESSITQKSDLQGRIGECDATTDLRRGSLLVRDEFGTLHHLAARSDEPIARGEAVLLIEYQANGDYFQVRSWRE